jgi:predicted PurR-regulated permease PerM
MPDEIDRPVEGPGADAAATVALIERSILVLLFVGLFIGVLAIVRPFTTAILFGAILATAVWPLRQALIRLGMSRAATAWLLLLLSLVLIVLPTLVIAPHLADRLREGVERIAALLAATPERPAWIEELPLVGRRLAGAWDQVASAEGSLLRLAEPYTAELRQALIDAARALADSVIQVLLSLIVATMFWYNADALISFLHDILRRLGGPVAEQGLNVAAGAIKGVAYGVIGTAVIQAVFLGLGLAAAGFQGAALFGFVGLLLALSQVGGPLLILIWGGAAWWLFRENQQAWGVFMIVWGLLISTIDNFIKPLMIGVGIDMPISLTILGVFGGFIAFGFLGLFIGPTLIAVMFTLIKAWRVAATARPVGPVTTPG